MRGIWTKRFNKFTSYEVKRFGEIKRKKVRVRDFQHWSKLKCDTCIRLTTLTLFTDQTQSGDILDSVDCYLVIKQYGGNWDGGWSPLNQCLMIMLVSSFRLYEPSVT